jgi:protein-tyrosine phosphatase
VIDLHGHLVFGVDDGPKDRGESLALARALAAAGVTTFACTSHVRPDKGWINDARVIRDNLARIAEVADEVGLSLVAGAEHYIDDAVFGDVDWAARVVPYGGGRWLLVETPYLGLPLDLLGLLSRIRRAGFKVLLAHVERFPYLVDDDALLERLLDAGHLFQVNLGSLAGAYNRAQQKGAEKLLKKGLAAVLAGDCHREVDVAQNIVAGRAAAKKLIDDATLRRLTVDAPRAILDDAPAHKVFP